MLHRGAGEHEYRRRCGKRFSRRAEKGIPAQRDVIRAGGTDAGAIHSTRSGVCTGGISVPCRYVHSPLEMVDKNDVKACAELVAAFAGSKLEKEC